MNYLIQILLSIPAILFVLDGVQADATWLISNFNDWTFLQQQGLITLVAIFALFLLKKSKQFLPEEEV